LGLIAVVVAVVVVAVIATATNTPDGASVWATESTSISLMAAVCTAQLLLNRSGGVQCRSMAKSRLELDFDQ